MIGSWGPVIFELESEDGIPLSGADQTAGANWAKFSPIGGKPRSQYMGSNLREFSATVELNAGLGLRPRNQIETLQRLAEKGGVYYLVINGRPVGDYPMKLTGCSATWGDIFRGGELWSAKISLKWEEYL